MIYRVRTTFFLFLTVFMMIVGVGPLKAGNDPMTLPAIFPAPQSVELTGGDITLGKKVFLLTGSDVAEQTKAAVIELLKKAGVQEVRAVGKLPNKLKETYVVLGTASSPLTQLALQTCQATLGHQKEGYTLSTISKDQGSLLVLAGADQRGLFYATQTFRQLASRSVIPNLTIVDYPTMTVRGSIEGFYGKPWTMEERAKHIQFLASVKGNTFVYSPKDDPYARDDWRTPYPKEILEELGNLAAISSAHQIDFVYAISPGPTVCFSSAEDLQLLKDKFAALRSVGIRSFYLALDDIEYTKWNCEADSLRFGPSGPEAAAIAQSYLLNALQADMKKVDPSSPPLIMVPTEYYDAKETPYKAALRKELHPEIIIQWTGTDVVPPSISINDAIAAKKAFGQKTLLWDNYPVNDYKESSGRLLLAPYDRREAGLSEELAGILSNPMNQEAASRVAVTGILAFAWHDQKYDVEQTWAFAARELAGNDVQTTKALLTFFDTQHLAPTFGTHPWQKQSPSLKRRLDQVRDVLATGDRKERQEIITELKQYAEEFTAVPSLIRTGVIDTAFLAETAPWLLAMEQWGESLKQTALGLEAANNTVGNVENYYQSAEGLAAEASKIRSIPGATRFEGEVKIADGVLDAFIHDAPHLIYYNKTEK